MEEAPVAEAGPMEGVRPVERVTMCEAVSAAMEDGRCTKTATVDRHPTTSEPTAMEGCAATTESTAVKSGSAAAETTPMETAAAATEATAAAATETTTAATMAAVANFGRETIGCKFR